MSGASQNWELLYIDGLEDVERLLSCHLLRAHMLAPDPSSCVARVNCCASDEGLAEHWQDRFDEMVLYATLALLVHGVHCEATKGPGVVQAIMSVVRSALHTWNGNADIDFWAGCLAAQRHPSVENYAALVCAIVRWQAMSKAVGRLLRAGGLE